MTAAVQAPDRVRQIIGYFTLLTKDPGVANTLPGPSRLLPPEQPISATNLLHDRSD